LTGFIGFKMQQALCDYVKYNNWKIRNHRNFIPTEPSILDQNPTGTKPDNMVQFREFCEIAEKILPEEQLVIFRDVYLNDNTLMEISEKTNTNPNTVITRHRLALKKLRDYNKQKYSKPKPRIPAKTKLKIIRQYKTGDYSYSKLADIHGCSKAAIGFIVNGQL
jgi:predicted DNA-binding protein YlxM (UPF0122 family)